ncbi:hypothetical protein ACFPZ0_11565 [Streptomonospora nanhaiensis]|uniref:Uncharacterized protein n=1 Tax=Streptomonospora nanhaiensis TaxID=1323731 RepID=A0A853BNE4_9ACTN|nr:hypothetical protein [Streptomonospora nanhaiensis]MBV2365744.1 hypothetical protein [Streptomonospora nanhaiensis]MBX9388901.1 hypothetical protein [Streptomonospora nanhaiensis]NYI96540.1 hypothetical protein [Streptomonospora nanhaiensis]
MGDLFNALFGQGANVSLFGSVIALNVVVNTLVFGALRARVERANQKDRLGMHLEEAELNEPKRRTLLQKARNRVLELRREDLLESYIPGWQAVTDFAAQKVNFLGTLLGQWLGPRTPFSQESMRQYYRTKKGDPDGLRREAQRHMADLPGYNTRQTTPKL